MSSKQQLIIILLLINHSKDDKTIRHLIAAAEHLLELDLLNYSVLSRETLERLHKHDTSKVVKLHKGNDDVITMQVKSWLWLDCRIYSAFHPRADAKQAAIWAITSEKSGVLNDALSLYHIFPLSCDDCGSTWDETLEVINFGNLCTPEAK